MHNKMLCHVMEELNGYSQILPRKGREHDFSRFREDEPSLQQAMWFIRL